MSLEYVARRKGPILAPIDGAELLAVLSAATEYAYSEESELTRELFGDESAVCIDGVKGARKLESRGSNENL